MRHTLAGYKTHKPDRRGPHPPRENRQLDGMPKHEDLDRKTHKAGRVGRVGKRPGKGW